MYLSIVRVILINISLQTFLGHNNIMITGATNYVKILWNDLFVKGSYNKFIRPVIDHNVPVILETRLNLVAILDVNAVEEKLTTTASLVLKWKDENLSWDPDDYGGVEELLIPQTEMWTPDMALDNNFNKMKGLGDGFVLINVKYDGSVYWEPYEVFVTKCAMNIENFPFDIQICHLNVGVWTNEIDKVLVRLDQDEISYEYFQENSEWDIIGQETQMFQTTTRNSMIEFSLKIKRKPQYYLYNIVAPILMLSILAVFTFAIPVESGEKLGFCMTVYLAFAVFLTIISSSLPVSSVMSLLGKYLLFLLIIGTLIVMICTLEIRIHFRRNSRRIPGCVQGLVRLSLVLQCRSCQRQKIDYDKEKNDSEENASRHQSVQLTWMDVSSAIDFYCFWIFLVTVTTTTLVLFWRGF